MEVWLNRDDAIRVKRLHENIRSMTIKIASLFFSSFNQFFLLDLDIAQLLPSVIDACLFVYPEYIVNNEEIPSRVSAEKEE